MERLIGSCHCKDRQEALNRLGWWAQRVISGKLEKAREYLEEILK